MTIENWALPIYKKAGFTPKKFHPIARSAVECACCEICFYNFGLQPETHVPPLMICTFVKSAAGLTIGYASKTLAAT